MKIEFAPLNIPFHRRLQTFMSLWFVSQFLFGYVFTFILIYLLFTRLFIIPLAYFAWFYYDRDTCERGGRRWKRFREWSAIAEFAKYFPITLVKTAELPTDKNYIFGLHPHGILSFSHYINFGTEGTSFSKQFPGIVPHLITLRYLFMTPIAREIMYFSGACSSSAESINNILTKSPKGNAAAIVVGGAREVLNTHQHSIILNLKNRKGFVRMALRHGASLVPVLSFGENDIYKTMFQEGSIMDRVNRMLIKYIGYPIPLFYGRGIFQYTFGLLPMRKPIVTVVGEPITVDKNDEPTEEEVDELHKLYMDRLEQLFDKHKHRSDVDETILKIK